jgi:hypothetical protein
VEANWQPVEAPGGPSRVQLAVPEPQDDSKSYAPPASTGEPPLNGSRSSSGLPVGIPQFAEVKENIATGLRPSPEDGFDWLRANRYRTVLHLHLAGEDDTADRAQAEKRGLTYLSLEIAPATVTRARADEFVALVRDSARQPLFVYDRDGSLAGPLWYYYLRSAESLGPDMAEKRARRLGLREERGGPYLAMWLAVQSLLGENSR